MNHNAFTSSESQPYGRTMGRTLDPMDGRDGGSAIEGIGSYALDDEGRPLDKRSTQKARKAAALARAKQEALAAAREKAKASKAARERLPTRRETNPGTVDDATSQAAAGEGTFMDKAKAAAPWILGAVVLTVIALKMSKS